MGGPHVLRAVTPADAGHGPRRLEQFRRRLNWKNTNPSRAAQAGAARPLGFVLIQIVGVHGASSNGLGGSLPVRVARFASYGKACRQIISTY
jgi:hypothetical protein